MVDRHAPGRRLVLGGLGGLAGGALLGCSAPPRSGAAPPAAPASVTHGPCTPGMAAPRPSPVDAAWVAAALREVERRVEGRVGVAAIDGSTGAVLVEHRSDERFAMCSTFKVPLAACVLQRADEGRLPTYTPIRYEAADLLDHAPVARAHLAEGALTVEALCAAAVEVSDNTAANLLLAQIGGPAGLTAFFRAIGDDVSRLDRDEPTLGTNLPGDPRDTTTPRAMAATFRAITLDDQVLSTAARARLIAWMIASTTGLSRLRMGTPSGWLVGDKTGSGERGAWNDVAVAWPSDRAPLVIACYVDAPGSSQDAGNWAHAGVARVVAEVVAPGSVVRD